MDEASGNGNGGAQHTAQGPCLNRNRGSTKTVGSRIFANQARKGVSHPDQNQGQDQTHRGNHFLYHIVGQDLGDHKLIN